MSYNPVSAHDISLEISGTVEVKFTCPRCGKKHKLKIEAWELQTDLELECDSDDCSAKTVGCQGFSGYLRSGSFNGSYLGLNDVPLK